VNERVEEEREFKRLQARLCVCAYLRANERARDDVPHGFKNATGQWRKAQTHIRNLESPSPIGSCASSVSSLNNQKTPSGTHTHRQIRRQMCVSSIKLFFFIPFTTTRTTFQGKNEK